MSGTEADLLFAPGMARTGTKRWINVALVIVAVVTTALAWSGVSLRTLLAAFPH